MNTDKHGYLSSRPALLSLGAVLLLEVALFSPAFTKFFCGDSLYYLSRRVSGLDHLWELFSRTDTMHSYRPLAYLAFTYLIYPLSGLEPRGYHVMSLGVHLLTSLLVFALLRRLARAPAAALAGLFFFGTHAVNFYITYDASFLPDFGMGLLAVGSLLAYAWSLGPGRAWWLARAASVALFALALLFKESAVVLPVGLAAVGLLARRREQGPGVPWLSLLPHGVVAAAYLIFQLYLRSGSLFPSQVSPYRLTLSPAVLFLKLKYLLWLWNLPADFERWGWLVVPPAALLLPALVWMAARLRAGWQAERRALLLCGAWAAAALLPVLFLSQVPMKHNLYLSVLALAISLAVSMDREANGNSWLAPRSAWFFLPVIASVAFQVRLDLKYSWVGEGSDIAEQSLAAVRRAYPSLPPGALLYVLPAKIRGNISWYFDGGSLFSLFYDNPTLHMRFADAWQSLPEDYQRRKDVFIFGFHRGRLYDVTPEHKSEAADFISHRLLALLSQAQVSTRFDWMPADLLEGQPAGILPHVSGNRYGQILAVLPGTQVRFPITGLTPDTVLRFGVGLAGGLQGGASARLSFESQGQASRDPLFHLTLDPELDGDTWWGAELELGRLAGRSGALVVENDAGPAADWVAWSGLRLAPRAHPSALPSSFDGRPLEERGLRLLDHFAGAQVTFDSSEYYPQYSNFDTPDGRPQFLWWTARARPRRLSLVTIAGARVKFPIPPLPPQAVLEVSGTHAGELGDGARGRIFWEQDGRRQLLFDHMVFPGQNHWVDREITLASWAGQSGRLSLECSSGPAGSTVADWFAWARLRIISPATPKP